MDKSQHLLVEWVLENKFSVISRTKIVDTKLKEIEDHQLVGKQLMCFWTKSKPYLANVLKCGEKENLRLELTELTKTNEKKDASKSRTIREAASSQIDAIVEAADVSNVEQQIPEVVDYKALYEKTQERLQKYKNKLKNTRAQLADKAKARLPEEMNIDIGSGVLISKAEMDLVKAMSGKPTVFARNLMRRLFEDSELRGKSLFGRKCNANDGEKKPSIDACKRDAIIAQTLAAFCGGKSDGAVILQLHRTMGDYIREISHKSIPADV